MLDPFFICASGIALLIGYPTKALTNPIICGRLITFYRPTRCPPGQAIAFVADCIIR